MTRENSTLHFFDPSGEEPFTLSRGHKSIDVSYDTLRNYAMVGRKSITGEIVKMGVCLLPSGALGTTLAAYHRFVARLNGAAAANDE